MGVRGKRHWSECRHEQAVFVRIMAGVATEHGEEKTVMIDAPYLKAHRNGREKGGAAT